MPRMFQLAIVLLPLALGAAGVGAQEPPRPAPPAHDQANANPAAPRLSSQRESLERWRRDAAQPPVQPPMRRERVAPPASQDSRSMSDAVRRVQRSTRGQILGAEQVPFEGRNITRVKYMDSNGRVRYMDDPGATERRVPRRADNGEP